MEKNTNNKVGDFVANFIENVKSVVDVDSVVGEPFKVNDEVYLIPITKISVGFVSGGGEYGCDKKMMKKIDSMPLVGGGGGGVTISPLGFIEVKEKSCKLIRLEEKSVYQNILDKIPSILEGISSIICKGEKHNKK